jgi:hypothetical protein
MKIRQNVTHHLDVYTQHTFGYIDTNSLHVYKPGINRLPIADGRTR